MEVLRYPPSPNTAEGKKINPSPEFRKQVSKVVGSIILFFIVYILLMLAAAALAVVCFYAGIAIIIAMPRLIGLLIGVGLMCLSISVIYFLIKFIFAKSKDENSSRVEIKKEEQPRLFAFISRLSKETHTPFPKKIFLSPNVNASVFYNSSFWSMFLPVKKNLEIGLGLVNSVNTSEFKAIIAHEFGHFSQRSMKLGSFTYNVNRVIYNMLYDNNDYTSFLNTWSRGHSVLRAFAILTAKIANGIQRILIGMYGFINKNYMGLSREMEFHADAVAASVSGGNNLVSSLSRSGAAENCYQTALANANGWLKENKISKNIFRNQLVILETWAKEHQLPLRQGLPEVSYQFIQSMSKSRINYKNQWASHPTLEERKNRLEALSIDVEPDDASAWELFDNAALLQEQITELLYKSVKREHEFEILNAGSFEEFYLKEKDKFKLPSAYQGFYTGRYIDIKDWEMEQLVPMESIETFDHLFSKENGSIQNTINSNRNDLELVKAFKEKKFDLKTFDFDGTKYELKDCDGIIAKLEEEIDADEKKMIALDKEAFIFFYRNAKDGSREIKYGYMHFQSVTKEFLEYTNVVNEIYRITQPFYDGGMTLERVNAGLAELKTVEEKLKSFFVKLIEEKVIGPDSDKELFTLVNEFSSKNYMYFISNQFVDSELNELRDLSLKVYNEFNEYKFRVYKNLLVEQLHFVSFVKNV